MDTIIQIISASFIAMFIENTIFSHALGTSTMIIAAKNKNQYIVFGISITYITCVSSIISYFTDKLFLSDDLNYMYMPIIYVLIVGAVYIFTLLILWKFANKIFLSVRKFIHISAFNCAVLGALFLNFQNNDTLFEYIGFGFGTGLGFMIATYLLSIAFDKLNSTDVPESFRGYPLILIYIGILSMAFYGLSGFQF